MGRIATKMPKLCLNKIRPLVRVGLPRLQSKNHENSSSISDHSGEKKDGLVNVGKDDSSVEKSRVLNARKIMIVVDSSVEAKTAVQWALSHTVRDQDIVILLHVVKPSKQGDQSTKQDLVPKIPEFLISMKSWCQLKRPEVGFEVTVVEGKEKGPAIVEATKTEGVAMLVVGQKKRSVTWRLMLTWAGHRAPAGGVAEYCVQNATCLAIAVRRKSKKAGGYLITTKRQKNFWLLA